MGRSIFTILGLVAAGGIFLFYTKPAYDGVQAMRTQIAEYDAALQKAAELQQRKQELLSRFNAFNPTDRERLEKLLPDHVDNVRLILDLDSLSGKHGMAVQNVVVSTPSSAQNTQGAASTISASKQKYDSLTLKFTTSATYETFQRFLTDLEQSLRIVDLVSLKIAAGGAPTTAGGAVPSDLYTFDIVLRTYWLK